MQHSQPVPTIYQQPLLHAQPAPVHYILAPQLAPMLPPQRQQHYPLAVPPEGDGSSAKAAGAMAGAVGKENAGDDMAQRLQRIEALAEEIAQAQVKICLPPQTVQGLSTVAAPVPSAVACGAGAWSWQCRVTERHGQRGQPRGCPGGGPAGRPGMGKNSVPSWNILH